MKPLYREDLDKAQCQKPGCTHRSHRGQPLYFHGRCHPEAATEVSYEAGVLLVACAVCKAPVAAVVVAYRPIVLGS